MSFEKLYYEAKSFKDFYYLKQLNAGQNFFNINNNSLKKIKQLIEH